MKLRLASFTLQGAELEKKLLDKLLYQGFDVIGFAKYPQKGLLRLDDNVRDFTQQAFKEVDCLVFIGSAGIAVRVIAPFIKSKDVDPAVIVIDDGGGYVIPILSGHLGGGNELSLVIAKIIDAVPVITTSTDINKVFAIDLWAKESGLHILDVPLIKKVSSSLLQGSSVGFRSDYEILGSLPKGLVLGDDFEVGISVSSDISKHPFKETLRLIPKDYYLGVGCRKGISFKILEKEVADFLDENSIPKDRVAGVASVDLKSEEPAILELTRSWKIKFQTFSAEQLAAVSGEFSDSDFVKKIIGVANVCERAAVAASGGSVTVKKRAYNGVTLAASQFVWQCKF